MKITPAFFIILSIITTNAFGLEYNSTDCATENTNICKITGDNSRTMYDSCFGYCFSNEEDTDNWHNCTIPKEETTKTGIWSVNYYGFGRYHPEKEEIKTAKRFSYNNAYSASNTNCIYTGTRFCITYHNDGTPYQLATEIINSNGNTSPTNVTTELPTSDIDICKSSYKNNGTCTFYGEQKESDEIPTTITCQNHGYVQDNKNNNPQFHYLVSPYYCIAGTCKDNHHFEADPNNLSCFGKTVGKCISNACANVFADNKCDIMNRSEITGNTTWNDNNKNYTVNDCRCIENKENDSGLYTITYKWSEDTYDKENRSGEWKVIETEINSCMAGYYKAPGETDCTQVGFGYYSPKNATKRTACPMGATTKTETSDSESDCYLTGETIFKNSGDNSSFTIGKDIKIFKIST